MSIESQLREALAASVDEADLGGWVGDPYARVSGAIAVDRRRRRTAVVAGVAAVAAVAVAVPTLAGGIGRDTTTPAKRTQVVVPGPTDPRWSLMSTWPTRGSLASDTAFVAAANERLATGDQNHVLYAGEVAGRRVVVAWSVSTSTGSRTEQLHLGVARSGAPAEDLVTSVAEGARASEDVALARLGMRPDSPLLVLTTPATRSGEVSASARVNADGSVTRTPWQRFELTDGAGVVSLANSPTFLTRVKVGLYDGQATGLVDGEGAVDQPPICLDLCSDFDERYVAATTAGVAQQLGVPREQVSTSVVYSGAADPEVAAAAGVTDAEAGTLRLVVADSRVGDAVLRSALLVHDTPGSSSESQELLTSVPLDALAPQPQPYVLRGLDPSAQRQLFQVFAPGAASARITSTTPTILRNSDRTPVTAGSATIRLDDTEMTSVRTVETYDASGDLIGSWPLDPPNAGDPFDTQP